MAGFMFAVQKIGTCLFSGVGPFVINLRCSLWCAQPRSLAATCYFQIIDGHASNWGFSTLPSSPMLNYIQMNCGMSMDAILSWMNLHRWSMFVGFVIYKWSSPELEEAFLIKDLIICSISINFAIKLVLHLQIKFNCTSM